MKTLLRILLIVAVIGAIAFAVWYFVLNRPVDLQARPVGTDGGLSWAYGLALTPARGALASDAVLVEAEGEHLLPDGRLAANTGQWRLSFSSFTANARRVVTVDHTGAVTVGDASDPGTIRALGLPPGIFPDSTVAFASTLGRGAAGTRTVINPVRLVYNNTAGAHVWQIDFNVNNARENHRVRWDGVWLGLE